MTMKIAIGTIVASAFACALAAPPAFADKPPRDRPEVCHPERQYCPPKPGGRVVADRLPLRAVR